MAGKWQVRYQYARVLQNGAAPAPLPLLLLLLSGGGEDGGEAGEGLGRGRQDGRLLSGACCCCSGGKAGLEGCLGSLSLKKK